MNNVGYTRRKGGDKPHAREQAREVVNHFILTFTLFHQLGQTDPDRPFHRC
jgi:hypothetical protein